MTPDLSKLSAEDLKKEFEGLSRIDSDERHEYGKEIIRQLELLERILSGVPEGVMEVLGSLADKASDAIRDCESAMGDEASVDSFCDIVSETVSAKTDFLASAYLALTEKMSGMVSKEAVLSHKKSAEVVDENGIRIQREFVEVSDIQSLEEGNDPARS